MNPFVYISERFQWVCHFYFGPTPYMDLCLRLIWLSAYNASTKPLNCSKLYSSNENLLHLRKEVLPQASADFSSGPFTTWICADILMLSRFCSCASAFLQKFVHAIAQNFVLVAHFPTFVLKYFPDPLTGDTIA